MLAIILVLCIVDALLSIGCLCSLHIVNWLSVVLLGCFTMVVGCIHMCLLDKLSVLDLGKHLTCCSRRQSYGETLGEEA